MSDENFDVQTFERRLMTLKDTQEGIQGLSAWCLQKRTNHRKIVAAWLNVLKQARVEQRLTLFYLANDVIQHSKRKNYEFVESWGTALQRATTMVRDAKVQHKIQRIFKIWETRQVYSDEFLADLSGLLTAAPPKVKAKEVPADPDEFQCAALVANIEDSVRLEKDTDKNFKIVAKATIPVLQDIRGTLKDRTHVESVKKEIDEQTRKFDKYVHCLKAEVRARKQLINALSTAETFYSNQRGEVKLVINAYKNFGNRLKTMEKKVEELTTSLPSPIPSPDIDAPSPEPDNDNDFELPTDASFLNFASNSGFLNYMDGSLPFDPMDFNRESPPQSGQSIQVINTDFYDPASLTDVSFTGVAPSIVPPVQQQQPMPLPAYAPITMTGYQQPVLSNRDAAFGDFGEKPSAPLLPPPVPPALEAQSSGEYSNWDSSFNWNSSQESLGLNSVLETPHSPPHYERKAAGGGPVIEYNELDELTGTLSDVDHRQLPDIASNPLLETIRATDIDHRNLISLTGSPGNEISTTSSTATNKISEFDKIPEPTAAPPSSLLWSEDTDFRKPLQPPAANNTKGDADFRLQAAKANLMALISKEKHDGDKNDGGDDGHSGGDEFFPLDDDTPLTAELIKSVEPVKVVERVHPSPSRGNRGDNVETIDMDLSDDDLSHYSQEEQQQNMPEENPLPPHSQQQHQQQQQSNNQPQPPPFERRFDQNYDQGPPPGIGDGGGPRGVDNYEDDMEEDQPPHPHHHHQQQQQQFHQREMWNPDPRMQRPAPPPPIFNAPPNFNPRMRPNNAPMGNWRPPMPMNNWNPNFYPRGPRPMMPPHMRPNAQMSWRPGGRGRGGGSPYRGGGGGFRGARGRW